MAAPWYPNDRDEESRPRGERVVVRLVLVRETDAAWLVRVPPEEDATAAEDDEDDEIDLEADAPREVWIPRSRCSADWAPGDEADVEMPRWLAENEGFDYE